MYTTSYGFWLPAPSIHLFAENEASLRCLDDANDGSFQTKELVYAASTDYRGT